MAFTTTESNIPMAMAWPLQTVQLTRLMEILIEDRQNRHKIDHNKIKTKAEIILKALGSPDAELSVLIVSDQEIAELNKRYLGRAGPTNVIAFPMREGPFSDITHHLLGDVVISVDTATREAYEVGITPDSRFGELLVHGILHLFGFDHEKTSQEAEAMRIEEEELVKLLQADRQNIRSL